MNRHLEWDGLFNARDLGGLPSTGGGVVRRGAVVRSENLDRLTETGWRQLRDHGIRTVVDLRNPDEQEQAPNDAVTGVRTVRVQLDGDGGLQSAFWRSLDLALSCTPLYYRPLLEVMPQVAAAAVAAVADAEPGGVLVHCAGGRDRTGLVVMLLLALVGVDRRLIADDHELSANRMPAVAASLGREDDTPVARTVLAQRGATWQGAVLAVLEGLDVEELLLAAGVTDAQLDDVRTRLLDVRAP
jgi:protein-tyrosine phosphatase